MKILVLGIGQSNFLNQLYGSIKEMKSEYDFYLDKFNDISNGKSKQDSQVFNGKLELDLIKISKTNGMFFLFNFLFSRLFYQIIFFELSQKSSFKKIKKQVFKYLRAKYLVKKHLLPLNFDIYHFHYCTPENLIYTYFLPNNCKIILSFWGSDLMRETGVSNVFYMQKALKKASVITMQSSEMKLIFQSKYGSQFKDKVKDIRFTIDTKIFEAINKFSNDAVGLIHFKKRYFKDENKTIIAIGHNAFRENNHKLIINQLNNISSSLKEKITFLLHLSYGGKEYYIEELKAIIGKYQNLDFVIIEDYFGQEDIAKLRLITNIIIQMPETDALSGAMTEVLYAGNSAITASWLPYGILRRNGINFNEIEDFINLNFTIERILDNPEEQLKNNKYNKEKIESFLFPNTTTKDWIDLIESI